MNEGHDVNIGQVFRVARIVTSQNLNLVEPALHRVLVHAHDGGDFVDGPVTENVVFEKCDCLGDLFVGFEITEEMAVKAFLVFRTDGGEKGFEVVRPENKDALFGLTRL